MKRSLLASFVLIPALVSAQAFSDDFESYTPGSFIAQNSNGLWTTWSNAPGTSEDATASDEYAHSGSVSAKFQSSSLDGGPIDFIHDFGNLTSGHYKLTLWMLVVDGSGGYFNLLHTGGNNAQWAFGAYFDGDGNGRVTAGGVDYPFEHVLSDWNKVEVDINMTADQAEFFMNGGSIGQWQWSSQETSAAGVNRLAWMDVYAYGGENWLGHFYIDDVSFEEVVINGVDELYRQNGLAAWPNPTKDILHVDLGTSLSAQARVELVDLTGKVLAVPTQVHGQLLQLDFSGLPEGAYFVRVADGATQRVGRVLRQ